jgi:hypothetical protein
MIIALSAGIVLSGAFTASAATKHHRVTHVHPAIYNIMIPAAVGGGCTASGGPACSSACSGPLCTTRSLVTMRGRANFLPSPAARMATNALALSLVGREIPPHSPHDDVFG